MIDERAPDTSDPDVTDSLAAAVLAVPGVASLHGGRFGEIATHLPGRRVVGIRFAGERGEVHITVHVDEAAMASTSVIEIAEAAREAASAIVDVPIDVIVEDLTMDEMLPTATGDEG